MKYAHSVLLTSSLLLAAYLVPRAGLGCGDCAGSAASAPASAEAADSLRRAELAIRTGRHTIVAFHSASCASCKIQKPRLMSIVADPRFHDSSSHFLAFEETRDLRSSLGVRYPSTVLVFKDGVEVARAVGETAIEKLRSTLERGL
jgi:hypothetical protein